MLRTMKKNLLIATLWATLLVSTAFSAPAGASEISDASLNGLLEASGIRTVVSQFPDQLRMRMQAARQQDRLIHGLPSMSDDDYRALVDTMVDAFRPAFILKAIGNEVRQSVSEQDAGTMLAWYDSPLGKKISRAEDDSETPQATRDMAKSAQKLMADKQRVAFALKLDQLLHMTDMSIQVQANTRVAMLVAFSTKKNEHQPANLKALRNRITAGLQKKRYKIRQSVVLSVLYAYRQIDMKALEQYRAFLGTPAALSFNQALMAGMDAGMSRAIDHLARSLENLMRHRHLQKA